MKKLLVAVDFSPASRYAYEYAEWLSLQLSGSLTAVFVNTATYAEITVSEKKRQEMINKENNGYRERLHQFTANYPDRDEEPLTAVKPEQLLVVTGRIAPALCAAALKIEADAIVVGTRAKHSLRDHLFGSVTTQLIGQTPCPLIIIPEGAAYKTVSRIALAVDIKQHEEPVLPALQSIATALEAEIHPFYVNFLPEEQDMFKEEEVKKAGHKITMVRERTLVDGVDYFLEKYPSEMLALYLPPQAFLNNLFRGRLSRHLAWKAPAPLLLM
ncbi:MAG: universal stress protein [Lewinellaceae bacterium]|nr:universal stress protein [Phaeodactylibacter sp.]MCB9347781.1 universal stress protein [Lewinellaceae bacterium]